MNPLSSKWHLNDYFARVASQEHKQGKIRDFGSKQTVSISLYFQIEHWFPPKLPSFWIKTPLTHAGVLINLLNIEQNKLR